METQEQIQRYYAETHRPQYHFSPERNWTNDPNGLVYYKGEYHLFYQYHPGSNVWGPMHWGHAVSTDLIHWTHLPIALYPDPLGEIWSGSAVVDANNTSGLVPGGGLVAIFTYTNQSQAIAYSTDNGRTWTKYAGNPIIPTGGKDFRDPKVFWHEPTGRWVLILAASDRAKIYTSPNLINWTFASDFGVDQGSHAGIWECPDLFPLQVDGQTVWVMIVSISDGHGTQYFVGNFDGTTFTNSNLPDTVLWIDAGPDNYAGITWFNTPDNSRVFIGWMNNWRYARITPTIAWRGAMTIPRALSLKRFPEGIRLAQTPIAQFEHLRATPTHWRNQTITPGSNLLAGICGKSLEIVAEFQLNTASAFGFRVLKGGSQATTIGYQVADAALFVDRREAGEASFHDAFADVYHALLPPVEGRIKLRILVDHSLVEVFGGEAQVVTSVQVFPDAASDQLELYAVGGDVTLLALDVYPINRIWNHSQGEQ